MMLRMRILLQLSMWLLLCAGLAGATPSDHRRGPRSGAAAHRVAAQTLKASGDLDGARLELRAAYVQSRDPRLLAEIIELERRAALERSQDVDRLLPVEWPAPDDSLLGVALSLDDAELLPVAWFRR
jgi:hypothetical protein